MKLIGLLDLPGTGTGPLRARSPQGRLCVGGLLLLAILIVPLSTPWGYVTLLGVAAVSIIIAGMPVRLLARTMLVFLILYTPLLVFLLLSSVLTADGLQQSALGLSGQFGAMAFRSFTILVVSASTVSTLTIADAVRGSSVLPIPQLVVSILFHVLHQASLMLRETVSISQAVAIRGASRGLRTGVAMARSLPSVWLPRVESRIERAARAADLRGADRLAVSSPPSPWRTGDLPFVLIVSVVPGLAAALRFLL